MVLRESWASKPKIQKSTPTEPIYAARMTGGYRAVCVLDKNKDGEQIAVWFFIGSHADYEKLLRN